MLIKYLRLTAAILLVISGILIVGCGGGGGGDGGGGGASNYCCQRGDLLCETNNTGAGICGSNQQVCCDSCCSFLCLDNCRCYQVSQSWCASSVTCGCSN